MIVIPNKNAFPQVLTQDYAVCNGTGSTFPAATGGHPKVMIGCDYSVHVMGGANGGVLKIKGQQKIGSEDWADGQTGTVTIKANSENRCSFKFHYPHYDGVEAGVSVQHRVLVSKSGANDQITLHQSTINPDDCVPTGTIWKQYFFDGLPPVEFSLSVTSDYNIIRPDTWPVKGNYTNNFNVSIGNGRFISFFQDDNTTVSYETVVWSLDGINIGDYPAVTQGATQSFTSPNSPDYANSQFIYCGENKAVGSWQDFGVIRGYIAAGGGLSLTEYAPGDDYPIPGSYQDALNCSRAALTYVESTDKLVILMQFASGDFQPYTRSTSLGNNGIFTNYEISENPVWNATQEYVDVESNICSGAFGDGGKFAYIANLYNSTADTRRIGFIVQSVNAAGVLSSFVDTNFPINSYNYTWSNPVALIGDGSNDRFIALMSSGGLLLVMFCTVSAGGVVSFTQPIELGSLGTESKYGTGAWIPNTDYCILQYSDGNNLIISTIDVSSGVAVVDETKALSNEGDGSELGQLSYDDNSDIFLSCYNEDFTPASNNHYRARAVFYKEPVNIELTSGNPVSVDLSAGVGGFYKIKSSASHTALTVTLAGLTGDLDLYVKAGERPTDSDYDDLSTEVGLTDEQCDLVNSVETLWYIAVDAYEAGAGTLTATLT